MKKRAVFLFNWHKLTAATLAFIQQQGKEFEELVFVIGQAERLHQPASGVLMEQLKQLFSEHILQPWYLVPVAQKTTTDTYYWLRLQLLCPPFQQAFIDQGDVARLQAIWQVPVQHYLPIAGNPLITHTALEKKTRGLFITRAQPFHLGHAAFIDQMAGEVDEVICLIAKANVSHTATDPATAGERLQMTRLYLEDVLPERYYLAALPYSEVVMENFYELPLLLPAFQYVYTSNPSVQAMAVSAGYTVRSLHRPVPGTATAVRDCLLQQQDYEALVPRQVYAFLQASGLDKRLQLIHEKEKR